MKWETNDKKKKGINNEKKKYEEENRKEETRKVNKKDFRKNIIKIIVILIVIIIVYLLIKFNKNDNNNELKPAPNITIDYNLLNIERSNGNIVMEDSTYAQIKDGIKRNTSSKVLEEKTYKDIRIKEAGIEASGGISQFVATIENLYEKNIQGGKVYIVFINEDGSEIARLETLLPDLEANSSSQINLGTDIDITNAYDFYIEAK